MAIISATNLLCSISLFHLTIAYFFLVSPSLIADQNLVYIFGAAMDLVSQMRLMDCLSYTRSSRVCFSPLIITLTQSSPTSTFFKPSPPLAFLSASLTLLGIADLAAVTLPEEIFSYYWSSQAPIRLLFFFVLTGYSYAFQPGGALAMRKRLGWDGLNNSVLFTWGFVEMLLWFWVCFDPSSGTLVTARMSGFGDYSTAC